MTELTEVIQKTGGKIFSVRITKLDGSTRRMTCRLTSDLPDAIDLAHNQIRVIDMPASKKRKATQYRTIRLDVADGVHFQQKAYTQRRLHRRSSDSFSRGRGG